MPSFDSVVTDLGPVRAHVRPVAEEIAERWVLYFIWGAPGRGTGDHAQGLALDFMTYELGNGVSNPGPLRDWVGNEIAAYVLENRVRLNVTYIIWNRRIASASSNPPWSWRTYTGSNPHTDHPHVSFESSGTYQPPEDELTPEQIKAIAKAVWEFQAEYGAVPMGEYQVGHGLKLDAGKRRDEAIAADVDQLLEEISDEGQ